MKLAHVLVAASAVFFHRQALADCGTPIECYEKSLKALSQARAEIDGKVAATNTQLERITAQLNSGELKVAKASSADTASSASSAASCGFAERAGMVRGRNDNHWMRFKEITPENNDLFAMWRTDGAWFDLISVNRVSSITLDCTRANSSEYVNACPAGYTNVLSSNANVYAAGVETTWWSFCCRAR